ncbi:hypothetical protein AEAC466_04555 [Asticcacaulis sp. AC466]|uniref:hypothetical protein n=1 Tax=Asticcacaulis sp. AC466 TaxID=1282362 RepID=UPI0003C3AEBB|nr:hypothetical protein [Asticcacaulis sp. AC466]ESQ85440.1 hypothetical protein AEAC466_04555 [Asticcacaulis sp. AC466]
MSIEALLAENTKAIQSLAEIMAKVATGQDAIVQAAKGATAAKASPKTEAKAETKAETKSDDAGKTEIKSDAKSATQDDLIAAIKGYAVGLSTEAAAARKENKGKLPEDGDWSAEDRFKDAEATARQAELDKLFKKVGATNYKTVPADKIAAVIKAVKTLTERGNILNPEDFADDAGGDAGGDDDDLLG